ncbi:MAG: phosphoribosylamine--glycine ligase [Flavobacteriales bacterium]|nr:phosphoribosylamine--glycine ligase [Flavobacteriales bacterium]MBP9080175.1 phosphoribosylamine--glycine ligase [Flavobacteriales bacterium]
MNVLLIGSGGREHALAWKLAQSSMLDELYIAPGNPGTVRHGRNVDLDLKDHRALRQLIIDKRIRMVVVGPEAPLVDGLRDRLQADPLLQDVTVIGPGAAGARLEGSKEFAKEFMYRHHIPTAAFRTFGRHQLSEALAHLKNMQAPFVIKADGLAQGKGVVVAQDRKEAEQALQEMLGGSALGHAADRVLIEQHLAGTELSVFLITDGEAFKMLPSAKDYKRIGDDDTGPNTGGMGAVSPVPFADKEFMAKVHDRIALPTVRGLRQEGIPYQGFLFIGLMNVAGDPYVIEYNVRLGDPETQAILPRLRSDLMDLFEGIATGTLSERHVDVDDRTCTTVVLASEGYPGKYETGKPIVGLQLVEGSLVFHSGTAMDGDQVVTKGGRVLSVTAFGKDMEHAIINAYNGAALINYEGKTHRTDIGHDLLRASAGRAAGAAGNKPEVK